MMKFIIIDDFDDDVEIDELVPFENHFDEEDDSYVLVNTFYGIAYDIVMNLDAGDNADIALKHLLRARDATLAAHILQNLNTED
jgi:hypothetical protein